MKKPARPDFSAVAYQAAADAANVALAKLAEIEAGYQAAASGLSPRQRIANAELLWRAADEKTRMQAAIVVTEQATLAELSDRADSLLRELRAARQAASLDPI